MTWFVLILVADTVGPLDVQTVDHPMHALDAVVRMSTMKVERGADNGLQLWWKIRLRP